MSCEKKFDRSDYELQLADYIYDALAVHGWFGAYVKHIPLGEFRAPGMVYVGGSAHEDVQTLEIFVGALDGTPDDSQPFENATLLESRWTDEGGQWDEYDMGDGTRATVHHLQPGERIPLVLPYFAIRLEDWPVTQTIEEGFGPRFKKALQLLLEICLDAREAALREKREQELEAAERLEPGPQPQEYDHPCERGESP